ncbi:hypothetical protein PAXRUDRAFT_585165 [Paxillus rubicundulus Ve08.2h10]|uniref:Uncharacterized protein n=1 Tax=Paxillus rubicundulus Ve08.2h10 TaxID=930991 RepID=A0A0D0DZ94_9AGAM|nr:hypothetical protein PAXRUDRAFT_585165 [Paxillus rubicundulus Ve08.2h10]
MRVHTLALVVKPIRVNGGNCVARDLSIQDPSTTRNVNSDTNVTDIQHRDRQDQGYPYVSRTYSSLLPSPLAQRSPPRFPSPLVRVQPKCSSFLHGMHRTTETPHSSGVAKQSHYY